MRSTAAAAADLKMTVASQLADVRRDFAGLLTMPERPFEREGLRKEPCGSFRRTVYPWEVERRCR